MGQVERGSDDAARIDAALRNWQQGDLALEDTWFFHVANPDVALTPAAAECEDPGVQSVAVDVPGLVIVSQTCDIVRACCERPFVEVSPLCRPGDDFLRRARRGSSVRFALVPGLPEGLAIDLEQTMTIEKSILVTWRPTRGCDSVEALSSFQQVLARRRSRFAFPDEFVRLVSPLVERIREKHGKTTPEGEVLRSLREIRVKLDGGHDGSPLRPFFWFVRDEGRLSCDGRSWSDWLNSWLGRVHSSDHDSGVDGVVVPLSGMTAADYVASYPLDLDYLSR